MPIDLEKLKSARVITDPGEIAAVMKRRDSGPELTLDDDAGVRFRKPSYLVRADDGLPKLDASKLQGLAESVGIAWQDGFEERAVRYWASDERVDSHGDIVRQNWLFDQFEENPVMPFSHNWDGKPVGNAIDWGVIDRKSKGYTGKALWLLGLFATADMNEEAESVFRLVKSGFLRGGSVGFRAGKVIEVTDDGERNELGLGRWGAILDENMLLEFSPTTLGANAGAMAVLESARKSGALEAADIRVVRELYRQEIYGKRGDREAWETTEAMVIATASRIFPDASFEPHRALDVPLIESVAPRKRDAASGTPPADPDSNDTPPAPTAVDMTRMDDRIDRLETIVTASAAAQDAANAQTYRLLSDVRELLEDLRDERSIPGRGTDDEATNGNGEGLTDEALGRALEAIRGS